MKASQIPKASGLAPPWAGIGPEAWLAVRVSHVAGRVSGLEGWASGLAGLASGMAGWPRGGMNEQTYNCTNI